MSNNKKLSNNSDINKNIDDNNITESQILSNQVIERSLKMVIGKSNPISNLSENSINKLIEAQKEENKLKYEDKKDDRYKKFISVIVVVPLILVFILVICYMFRDNTQFLEKVLPALFAFIIGAGGGYGFGKSSNKNKNFNE